MSGVRTVQASPVTALPNRDETKRCAARAWDRAIRASGYTNEYVAAQIGVSEKRVRRQRSDDDADLDVIPTAVEVLLADHELGERFLQELRVERLAMHGAPPAVTREQKALRAASAASRFAATVSDAVGNDGVIDRTEEPEIEAARADMNRESDDLGAIFHGRKDIIR